MVEIICSPRVAEILEKYRIRNLSDYVERLRHLLYGWIDEIPSFMVHNAGDYKVRSIWFQHILNYFDIGFQRGYLDEKLQGLYNEFVHGVTVPRQKRRSSKEDIEKGNQVLRTLIQYLESSTEVKT